jgi:hydrogenase/urease accessory protein HupE
MMLKRSNTYFRKIDTTMITKNKFLKNITTIYSYPKIVAMIVLGIALLNTVGSPGKVYAHPFSYGVVETELKINDAQIYLHTDIRQTIPTFSDHNNPSDQFYKNYFTRNLIIQNDSRPCSLKSISYSKPTPNNTAFNGMFTCSAPVRTLKELKINNKLFDDYFASIDHFVTLKLDKQQQKLIFTQLNRDYPTTVKPIASSYIGRLLPIAGQFIKMGVKHIWTGYDHLLFLLSIVLLVRSISKILIIVTTFTIAHSLTLILATLHVITISPRIVEPLICLTIIYAALLNMKFLVRSKSTDNTYDLRLTTAGFGLIHGLGFAGALRAASLPTAYFVPSLLFFNLGIEIGQLLVLCIFIAILLLVDKSPKRREILAGISIATITIATFWFIERIFIT